LLGDVYKIVNQENVFGRMNHTNPECPVGKQMNNNLEKLFDDAESELIKSLNHKTLKQFCDEFQ